ncbi:MAG TPA: ABC transporter permease [Pyrinomonadaceae bacterium]|jgi:predicted permease|nr:ABC transporter permease [Pyrinomonadaceae bacterium]
MERREHKSGLNLIESLGQDVRYGIRVLLRNRGFTLMAVITLALGVGANTAIFSVIYGVLLRPLPYRDGHQMVVVHQQARQANVNDMGFSVKEVFDYREQNKTMESVVEHHSMSFILFGREEPERVQTGVVSANFFDVLGVKPILGRTFTPEDEKQGADAVLVLSNKYWQQSHGGDPNIVGRIFRMNNRTHVVIGVLPPIPQYPSESDVYMPTTQCPFRSAEAFIENRNARMMTVFGRLKPGVKLEQAQADLSTIAGNLQAAYPDSYPKNEGYTAQVVRLDDELTERARPTFLILLATAGLVLLIACANVANLSLARVLQRQHEVAMRTALGASRGRLIRQLLTESTLLALVGGGLGLLIAEWGLPLLVAFAARFTNRTGEIRIDLYILLFTLIVAVGTGLAFGLIPALSFRQDSKQSLSAALKEDSGRSTAGGRNRLRSLLVVTQVALSFTLLIAAGLMLRSLIKLQHVNPGFNPEKVLVMRLAPNWSRQTTNEQAAEFARRLIDRVKEQPGVSSAALASTYPLNPRGITRGPNNIRIQLEGHPLSEGQLAPQVDPRAVTPDYFQTIGAPLIRGRMFTEADDAKAPSVAIVNESAARHRWGGEDPVGKRVTADNGQTWVTIVGVVGDVKQYGLEREPSDELYNPVAQAPFAGFLLVKTMSDPSGIAKLMRNVVHQVEPDTAVDEVRTLQQVVDDSVASPRLTVWLLGLFAALALIITAAGITGVMALSVTQRTREIGIRMALGATRGRILTMVMRQGMTLVLLGLVVGVIGALLLNRLMAALLFATPAADPLTFAAVSLLLTAVAGAACLVPALRATGIDPMLALRSE